MHIYYYLFYYLSIIYNMKKMHYLLALAVMTVAAMVSCSSDDDFTGSNPEADGTKVYTRINVTMDGIGTRADNTNNVDQDFQYGTAGENKVSSVVLAFYGTDGSYITQSTAFTLVSNNTTTTPGNVAVQQLYEIEVPQSAIGAAKMVAYVNMDAAPTAALTAKELVPAGFDTENKFIMTNSAYYNGDTEVKAVEVAETNFYKKGETPAPSVDVYVERVAAKIEVTGINKVEAYKVFDTEGTEVELTFEAGNWFVQSTAETSYLLKELDNDTKDWANAANNFRNYWAQAVGYDRTATNERNPNLKYVTYADGTASGFAMTESGTGYTSDAVTYVQENTFPASHVTGVNLSTYNPWYNITVVIIPGHYDYEGADEDETFYLREGIMSDEQKEGQTTTTTTKKGTFIYNTKEAIERILADADITVDGKTVTDLFEMALGANVGSKPEQNDAYLAVKENASFDGVTVKIAGVEVTANHAAAIAAAVQNIAPMKKYEKGNAYFAVPLKHYVAGDATSTTPYIKFSDLKTGNYGVVRNNWYVLSVGTIAGLATGVGDETKTEPTVDPDPDKYMIDVVLRVLQWHMRNQTVDL